MLNIGDYAQHQLTAQIGQVIGYGHQVLDGVYQTTLTVRVTKSQGILGQSRFLEDVYSAWVLAETTDKQVASGVVQVAAKFIYGK